MVNYFEKRNRVQQEQKKYYREKTNLRLKYAALISIGISMIIMLIMALGMVDFGNANALLFLRGCAGFFALIFVGLVGILVYRVNASYFKDKANPTQKH
ncbi:MAG: hypothetical protein K2O00_01260 [Muribaculaceae bacterium]|nr:hypothetical protein [Muribaculaceae bacterium]